MLITEAISRQNKVSILLEWPCPSLSRWVRWGALDRFITEHSPAQCVLRLPAVKQFQGQSHDQASIPWLIVKDDTFLRQSTNLYIVAILCSWSWKFWRNRRLSSEKNESAGSGYFIIDKHVRLFFFSRRCGEERKNIVVGHRQGFEARNVLRYRRDRNKARLIRFRRELRHCLSLRVISYRGSGVSTHSSTSTCSNSIG